MAKVTATVYIGDAEQFRLFLWELRELADKMRVEACPHGDALAHAVDRFVDGQHSDREDRADG